MSRGSVRARPYSSERHAGILGNFKGRDVSNLLSNGSEKNIICTQTHKGRTREMMKQTGQNVNSK